MSSSASVPNRRPDIPGLTGLRFFAAGFVVLSHALLSVQNHGPFDSVTNYITVSSALGMTLFFVLSGFVIHYNYSALITSGGTRNYWTFFVARFARLYPLYFVLLATEILLSPIPRQVAHNSEGAIDKLLIAGPFYLTLTQSWFFGLVGNNNLIYQFPSVGPISWSISTEWFFYLAYPVICLAISVLRPVAAKAVAALILIFFAIAGTLLVINQAPEIDAYALRHYGPVATLAYGAQDSLYRWIIYFSPYSRISEFALGTLVAAIHQDLRTVPISRREQSAGLAMSILGLTAILVLHLLMFKEDHPFPILTSFHMNFGFAVPVGVLIFCIARYGNPATHMIAWRPFVLAGEVSYSFYLVHFPAIGLAARHGFLRVAPGATLSAWSAALGVFGASLAIAAISYRLIESPARRWFRIALSDGAIRNGQRLSARSAVSGTRILVVLCLLVIPFAIVQLRSPPIFIPPANGLIDVTNASYGRNCGTPVGNATASVVRDCTGTRSCTYIVDHIRLGDPAGGCAKDFQVEWRCGQNQSLSNASVPGEAGVGGKRVTLACPAGN